MRRSGELERAVMDVLWESREPRSAKEVLAALPEEKLAHTTVITVLDRLTHKGLARRERAGRSWRYAPAASRESYVSSLMIDALGRAPDREAVLVHFAHAMTGPEADALRSALATADGAGDAVDASGAVDAGGADNAGGADDADEGSQSGDTGQDRPTS
ncbi:BlaI/MecI/CopY family transcriptional regulator [Streptomyces zagrosensis]|uniref:Putative transcriptional regulator n=1 Tax=Streptomyces zagrosensis TaxID=1042984 RepID=A0A7W9Q6L2_9ACTN|nr:BlaI/MecI/CopY family transcriptional regulator [Streptomyces zagrosensis]MBB5934078.1 putative transcriptional regulator [Streptomyces zagrosensis]